MIWIVSGAVRLEDFGFNLWEPQLLTDQPIAFDGSTHWYPIPRCLPCLHLRPAELVSFHNSLVPSPNLIQSAQEVPQRSRSRSRSRCLLRRGDWLSVGSLIVRSYGCLSTFVNQQIWTKNAAEWSPQWMPYLLGGWVVPRLRRTLNVDQ